jgi:hypothetical protein
MRDQEEDWLPCRMFIHGTVRLQIHGHNEHRPVEKDRQTIETLRQSFQVLTIQPSTVKLDRNTVQARMPTGNLCFQVSREPSNLHLSTKHQERTIIITGGNSGMGRAMAEAFAAAKAGVLGLTYGFARELSSQGITVNAGAPGFIADTGFTGAWPQERIRGIIEQTPVRRAGHVNEVAAAVLYLASPEASFVTSEVLNVNGGWLFGH